MDNVDAAGLGIGDDYPPRIMGVLNVSEESPYDPSVYDDPGEAARYVDDELIEAGATGADGAVKVEVIDENGNNVPDATVVATADSAQLDGVVRAEPGTDPSIGGYSNLEDNEAVLVFDGDQDLRADQDLGEIELEIIPPSDSNYIDEQPNPDIRVASSL